MLSSLGSDSAPSCHNSGTGSKQYKFNASTGSESQWTLREKKSEEFPRTA